MEVIVEHLSAFMDGGHAFFPRIGRFAPNTGLNKCNAYRRRLHTDGGQRMGRPYSAWATLVRPQAEGLGEASGLEMNQPRGGYAVGVSGVGKGIASTHSGPRRGPISHGVGRPYMTMDYTSSWQVGDLQVCETPRKGVTRSAATATWGERHVLRLAHVGDVRVLKRT